MSRLSIAERTLQGQVKRIEAEIAVADAQVRHAQAIVNTLANQRDTLTAEMLRLAKARTAPKP